MKRILIFLCFLGLATACQKKYDAKSYEPEQTSNAFYDGNERLSKLRDDCLIFMNYCDRNYSKDLKLFVRDYLRTFNEWKTDDTTDLPWVISYRLKKKEVKKYESDIRSIYFSIWNKDDEPPYFKAEYNLYSGNVLNMAQQEFGEPDEKKEIKDGTIYKWYISDVKTIYVKVVSGSGRNESEEFGVKYVLVEN